MSGGGLLSGGGEGGGVTCTKELCAHDNDALTTRRQLHINYVHFFQKQVFSSRKP